MQKSQVGLVFIRMSGNINEYFQGEVRSTTSSGSLPPIEEEFSIRNTPKDQAEEFYHPVDFVCLVVLAAWRFYQDFVRF